MNRLGVKKSRKIPRILWTKTRTRLGIYASLLVSCGCTSRYRYAGGLSNLRSLRSKHLTHPRRLCGFHYADDNATLCHLKQLKIRIKSKSLGSFSKSNHL
ncbi:Hypothetical predicted protein [Octopus vulgaris]|uniref:Uncharacterized protein n=1 Tax=Octopus vulgaris TaxID=6645 RepID=A0AA36B1S2_OCTVU|nr:Hypothetical predicted protein [Octopus vulgaris]